MSGLAADETLFRHDHPAELADAALVRLTGEVAEASPDHRGLTVRFAGREVASGTILPGALTALGKLPVKWLTAEGGALTAPVTVAELKLLKPATFGDAFVGGRKAATFEAELYARICVSLPRGDGATS